MVFGTWHMDRKRYSFKGIFWKLTKRQSDKAKNRLLVWFLLLYF